MRRYERWQWELRFAAERVCGIFSARDFRLRLCRLHGCSDPPLAYGWSGPFRRWLQQCCRCGRLRFFGKFYEAFAQGLGQWYYACSECCLAMVTDRMEQAMKEHPGLAKAADADWEDDPWGE